jgi:hypothetical protein
MTADIDEEPFDIGAKLKQRLETTKLQKETTQVRLQHRVGSGQERNSKLVIFLHSGLS